MLTLFPIGILPPLNNNGGIEPSGTLTFYATGTTDLKTVYHDADGEEPWLNPVDLDGNGRAVVFLDDDGAYDIIFKDADGVTVWTLVKIAACAPAF